jgi:pyrroline-5-carboxylate reductase
MQLSHKLGFIGAGNMSSAIIGGVVASKKFLPSDIIASDLAAPLLEKIAKECGIKTTFCNKEVAKESDVLFLCTKPHIYRIVIDEVKELVKPGCIIVTIAAGQTLDAVVSRFNRPDIKIVRTMPNTPALVGQGMTAICPDKTLNQEDIDLVLSIFNSIGLAELLEERLFDAFTGVAGSAPAYAFLFIEAMADAGVKHGLPRDKALVFSAQTLLGAADMLLKTKEHPGVLKDGVCSPGGTTIEAVCMLETKGFRDSVISAVTACVEKSIKMSK